MSQDAVTIEQAATRTSWLNKASGPLWMKLAAVFLAGGLLGAISVIQVVPSESISTSAGPLLSKEEAEKVALGDPGATVEEVRDSKGNVIGYRTVRHPGSAGSTATAGTGGTSGSGALLAGAAGTGGAGSSTGGGSSGGTSGGGTGTGCSGGATATGVTSSKIVLGVATVQDGIGKDFLGEMSLGMEAARIKAGKICGRELVMNYRSTKWEEPQLGLGLIKNFIEGTSAVGGPTFALAVVPQSEGLRLAIKSGDINGSNNPKGPIPVVGTGGMLVGEHLEGWDWPVAVSSASSARIMALNAYNRMSAASDPDATKSSSYSIVFDNNYRFGAEAAEAFNNEVKRITGSSVPGYSSAHGCSRISSELGTSFCGVVAGQSSYGTQVQNFQKGKFVALFLEPATALAWMNSSGPQPSQVTYGVGAGQPLFTRAFGSACQVKCHGMWVWSGYKPYIETYKNDAAVRDFVTDLESISTTADPYNQFTEGAYLGMQVLIKALRNVGGPLTRPALRDALNSLSLSGTTSLQGTLAWSAGNHFPAATMRAFEFQYQGTFSCCREKDITVDPNPQGTAAGVPLP